MGHSEAYFGDTRNHWWHVDFLALMAKRWRLGEARSLLDVGSGLGHWSRLLSRFLAEGASITGLDREAKWVEQARASVADPRVSFVVGEASALPWPDASFDVVTCQTVLIHMRDPAAVVREMFRVTKPGGVVIAAEPNNLAGALTAGADETIEQRLELVRLQIICERGKAALGGGDNSIGEHVPRFFVDAGATDVAVHQSDRAFSLLPPYASDAERAERQELARFTENDFWIWSRADTERYFLAGGGAADGFLALWSAAMRRQRAVLAALAAGSFNRAGGQVFYLVSGRKR